MKMPDVAESLPLTKEEIEKERAILQDAILPLSPRETARDCDEIFAEVRVKYAKF
jgi:hypothetical protein